MSDPLEKKIVLEEELGENNSEMREPLKKRCFSLPRRRILFIGVGVVVLVAFFFSLFFILPILRLRSDINILTKEARGIYEGIQTQDLNQTIAKVESTNKTLVNLESNYKKLVWLKVVPFIGGYYQDGERLINSSRHLLEATDVAVESLQPYADILGLEEKEKKKDLGEMTAEERLMLALDTLDKIQPNLEKIGERLELARKEIDRIDPHRYPEVFLGRKIRGKVTSLVKMIDGVAQMASEARPIARYLKPLLGIPEEKKYLLLFQNDAELRPTGGFLTAYGILSVHNGKFTPLASHDIYTLDARFGNRLPPPEPIKKYHKNVFYWHLRDMNLSPDFAESMKVFWENYKKIPGTVEVDGIVAVDTKVLVDILRVLGPIGVAKWGNFSAENDPRCNCPQVFYELERYADKPVGTWRVERKAVIGPLTHSILLNIMQSPRKKWPEFFNVIFSNIQEKHLLFYFFDEEIQKAIEALNAGGRIKDYDGDYLHINDCNFAGAKSNMFVEHFVRQEIEIKDDGSIFKTISIDYKNPEPPSDCNLERGELCLNAMLRDWVRFYVPKGSELLEFQGSEMETKSYEELGKQVFEGFLTVRPLGKAIIRVRYKLPFKLEKKEEYRLFIQKQPGAKDHQYEIIFNGQKMESFNLRVDREIKLET